MKEQRCADTGSEGRHEDDTADVATGTEGHLGDSGGVGIVDHRYPAW